MRMLTRFRVFRVQVLMKKVIVHQINHGHATKQFCYVALSRATNLNNIYIYKGNNELMNEESIKTYFTKK